MAVRDTLTRNQLCVLERLETATGPLSAYTLLDQLRDQGFRAPLQVDARDADNWDEAH